MAKDLAARMEQTTAAAERPATLVDRIRAMEQQFQLAMPKGKEATQLVRDALTTIRKAPNLANANPNSVLGAFMTCAQLGLRPGVLGQAWVLPFKNWRNGEYEAQLIIGYQGLVDLAMRTGHIASIISRTVYEGDIFDVDYGLDDRLTHKPNLDAVGERNPIAYYTIVKYTGGGHAFYVMGHKQMERWRDKNAMARTKDGKVVGPWKDHFEPMAHKTCFIQLAKWMPKSPELASAIANDSTVRLNLTPEAVDHPNRPDEPIDVDIADDIADDTGTDTTTTN